MIKVVLYQVVITAMETTQGRERCEWGWGGEEGTDSLDMFSAEQTGGANAQGWDHPRLRVSRNSREVSMAEASQRGEE